MAKKKTLELSSSQKLGLSVGLTAAAVAAAGAYFLYGSDEAANNRKKVKGWALKAKGEVLEALEGAEHMTEEQFGAVVEKVLATYNKARTLSKSDVKSFKAEMMESWGGLIESGAAKLLTAEQVAKKTAKKVTKKVTKTAKVLTGSKPAKKSVVKKAAKKATVKKVAS